MKAIIEIPCDNPELLKKVLEPEKEGDEFSASLHVAEKKLVIEIKACRLSMLQAGVNSYLRLLKAVEKL
jgi:tRNA threonylcarbamoyladenosine modification (KEOPS) complex  Pcc1 subunit